MNESLLHKEVQQFINDNLNTDIHNILLGKKLFPHVENRELTEQLESKKKAKNKLPTWFRTKNIFYANKLNISQTSSEICAQYKAKLVSGETLADLTGGFGVDSYFFSKKFQTVFHIEKQDKLSRIARHNFGQLDAPNIKSLNTEGISFLRELENNVDCIYLDPSRRDTRNNKVYFLEDCEPNITLHLDFLFSKSQSILIKTGPMLDISQGLNQLRNVAEIHIISIENDVKEILWLLKPGEEVKPLIKTVDFNKGNIDTFQFYLKEKNTAEMDYSTPLNFLYEPNAAIMKSGAFSLIGKRYRLKKLQEHSHLYTSEEVISFPGRVFKIVKVIPYSKRNVKMLGLTKANITIRNFPVSVSEIRKKSKLKDGGENFLFFTKDSTNNLIVISTVKTASF